MPRGKWNISAADIDSFDRSSQYAPYAGPIPPNGVYEWLIKTLRYAPATNDKHEQLRIGLEFAPRQGSKKEQCYAGYFVMVFMYITPKSQFRYVPFLDAIGVRGSDFVERTVIDADGNITRIGKWRHNGEQYILGQLKDGQEYKGEVRKDIGWFGPIVDDDDDDDDYDDDDDDDDDDDAGDGGFDDDAGF